MGIPKGFSPPAQGWRFSANPGERQNQEIQPRRSLSGYCHAKVIRLTKFSELPNIKNEFFWVAIIRGQ
jgi:hypothetical protein